MSAATAVALVAVSATLTMAAPRSGLRTEASRAPANFNWQTFAPGHLVHMQPSNGTSGASGDTRTESLQAPAMSFAWQIHTPGRLVHNENPKGAGSLSSGDSQADALRAQVTFNWQTFAPGHLVYSTPSKGAAVIPGNLHTDAIRSSAFRPTLVYGLGRDDAGGVRAAMGVSFRIR